MKRVVSVSIGSSKRDHRFELEVLGERIVLERIGTDGDIERAKEMLMERKGISDSAALELMLRHSRETATPLSKIAESIILASPLE